MHHEHTVQVEPQGSLLLSVPCFALGQAVLQARCMCLPTSLGKKTITGSSGGIKLLHVCCREEGTPWTPILNSIEQQTLRFWDWFIQPD